MLEVLGKLTPELVAGAFVGFAMLGVVIRNVIVGWREATATARSNERQLGPLAAAVAISWDRDQVERALQALESIAESLALQAQHTAAVAKAQGIMSDQFQQSTQSKLNALLDRLDHAEKNHPGRRR